jgi:hypothetical protein
MLVTTFQNIFPKFFDFSEFTLVDLIQIAATVFIGFAAIFVSVCSYRLSKRSIEHEKNMRKLEVNVSVLDRVYKVYSFFTEEMVLSDFLKVPLGDPVLYDRLIKINSVLCEASYIFNQDTIGLLTAICAEINSVLINGKFPPYDDTTVPDIIELLNGLSIEEKKNELAFIHKVGKLINIILPTL